MVKLEVTQKTIKTSMEVTVMELKTRKVKEFLTFVQLCR